MHQRERRNVSGVGVQKKKNKKTSERMNEWTPARERYSLRAHDVMLL